MERQIKHYEFINSQTDHVIAYYSLPVDIPKDELQQHLEKKRAEFAIAHQLYTELIYWRLQK